MHLRPCAAATIVVRYAVGWLGEQTNNAPAGAAASADHDRKAGRAGSLPENVNYAVKSGYLLTFLESVPEVEAKLKEPNAKDMKSDDVAEQAKEAACPRAGVLTSAPIG